MLISLVDGAVQAGVQASSRGGGTVIYAPSASQDILTGVLKDTLQIQPTVVKRNGDRIEVLVARDIDFRPVYELAAPAASGFSRALPGAPAPVAAGGELSALELNLRALRPLLANPDVTELCINRPRELFIETHAGWRREEAAFADFDWCVRLAKLIANVTRQRVDEAAPLLSAALPSGERVQIVLPPATTLGCVAITIRRPSDTVWSLEELARGGAFAHATQPRTAPADIDAELLRLHARGRISGLHATGGACPQEHRAVRRNRFR